MTVKAKYGGKRIKHLVDMAKEMVTKFGVLKGTGEHPSGTAGQTMALIAAWNEFGTRNAPSRPWLRTSVRAHRYYKEELKRILKKTLNGGHPLVPFKLLGQQAASNARRMIDSNSFAPNALSTILKKSTSSGVKDKPLVDTGALRQSIQSAVEVSK